MYLEPITCEICGEDKHPREMSVVSYWDENFVVCNDCKKVELLAQFELAEDELFSDEFVI